MANQKPPSDTCLERCLFLVFNLPELTYKRGKSAADIREMFITEGYNVSLRTIQRYITKLLNAHVITFASDDGRKPTYCRNFKG